VSIVNRVKRVKRIDQKFPRPGPRADSAPGITPLCSDRSQERMHVVRVVAQSKIGTNFINSRRPFTQGHSELLPDPRLEYDTRRVCTAVYGVAKPKQRNPNCDSAPRVGSSRHVGARGRRRHSSSQCAIAPRGIREIQASRRSEPGEGVSAPHSKCWQSAVGGLVGADLPALTHHGMV
jgi:hypothetical protein